LGISIVDVAKHAGTSPSTVARVANGSPLVAAETVERVKRAMQDLGYAPAPPALRRGPKTEANQGIRTRNIAMLLVGMEDALVTKLTSPGPVAQALAEHGLSLIYVPMKDPSNVPSIINLKQIDGALIQGLEPSGKAAQILRKIPLVWMLTRRSESFWADSVEPDNRAVGEMAANYLISRGHKNLGYVNVQTEYPAFRKRGEAFASHAKLSGATVAMIEKGPVNTDPALTLLPDEDVMKAHISSLLNCRPQPTAFFISSPLPFAYAAFAELGVTPGRDVEVIYGDNAALLYPWIKPRPVCIEVGISTIAHRAVDQLVWRIKHPNEPGPIRLAVSPTLMLPTGSGLLPAAD